MSIAIGCIVSKEAMPGWRAERERRVHCRAGSAEELRVHTTSHLQESRQEAGKRAQRRHAAKPLVVASEKNARALKDDKSVGFRRNVTIRFASDGLMPAPPARG